MKRDMNLIRELMLKLEALPMRAGGIKHIEPHDDDVAVEGYDVHAIGYHLNILIDAGFIDDGNMSPNYGIGFRGLTWEAHDFLDSIRDPEIWKKKRVALDSVGGFTVELVKSLAMGFLKQKATQYLGISLG